MGQRMSVKICSMSEGCDLRIWRTPIALSQGLSSSVAELPYVLEDLIQIVPICGLRLVHEQIIHQIITIC
jgi:hypothetical protein